VSRVPNPLTAIGVVEKPSRFHHSESGCRTTKSGRLLRIETCPNSDRQPPRMPTNEPSRCGHDDHAVSGCSFLVKSGGLESSSALTLTDSSRTIATPIPVSVAPNKVEVDRSERPTQSGCHSISDPETSLPRPSRERNDRTRWPGGSVPWKNRPVFASPNQDAESAKTGGFFGRLPSIQVAPDPKSDLSQFPAWACPMVVKSEKFLDPLPIRLALTA